MLLEAAAGLALVVVLLILVTSARHRPARPDDRALGAPSPEDSDSET